MKGDVTLNERAPRLLIERYREELHKKWETRGITVPLLLCGGFLIFACKKSYVARIPLILTGYVGYIGV